MKIAAVVVTRNRIDKLKKCIDALRHQSMVLNDIIVIDNDSTDLTKEWLDAEKGLTVVHQGNEGSSGGQRKGCLVAIEKQHASDNFS